ALSDVASTWWAARRDPGEIPLGQIEFGGLSDASVLVETYGWTEQALVARYLAVAGLCLAALAVVGTLRALRPLLQARGWGCRRRNREISAAAQRSGRGPEIALAGPSQLLATRD